MKKAILPALILLVLAGCARTTALTPVESKIYLAKSTQEVEIAIMEAAAARRWSPEKKYNGLIEARRVYRNYEVVVEIVYDASEYVIHHKRSTNMKASGNVIHENYYTWVNDLDLEIQKRLVK